MKCKARQHIQHMCSPGSRGDNAASSCFLEREKGRVGGGARVVGCAHVCAPVCVGLLGAMLSWPLKRRMCATTCLCVRAEGQCFRNARNAGGVGSAS